MPWITPVLVQMPQFEGDLYETIEPLGFLSEIYKYRNGKFKTYIVPRRYRTDLSSVPRLPVVYWLVGGRGEAAAVVHDFLYDNGIRLGMIADQEEADAVYHEILICMQVPRVWADAMRWAVMRFGEDRFHS